MLLGLYSSKATVICVRMFAEASFVVGKTCKQLECHSTEDGLHELQHIQQGNPEKQMMYISGYEHEKIFAIRRMKRPVVDGMDMMILFS